MTRFRFALVLWPALGALAAAPASAELRADFREPPSEFKAMPLWHLNGTLTPEGIAAQMRASHDVSGFGGVTVLPVHETRPAYLSEEYFARYGEILQTARESGMRVVFYDDTFAFDSGSLVLNPEVRWNFLDGRDAAFGLLLGYRDGRDEEDPGLLGGGTGSTRLQGMGTIDTAVDAGVQGHVLVFGVPLFAQVRSALNSEQGTLAILGAYVPLKLGSSFELTVMPTVTWADSTQMQAFYSVTPVQSARSGFRTYEAGSGWQSAALEIGGDLTISGGWHAIGSVAYQRLLADAAASPVVQEKGQASGLLGLSYRF